MEEKKQMSVEEMLKMMEQRLGQEPRPMVLMSKLMPALIPKHMQDMKFVMELPNIPAKYKHLIMIAVTIAFGSHHCTESQIKIAHHAGVSREEIAEAIAVTRFTLGATSVVTATEGMEYLLSE